MILFTTHNCSKCQILNEIFNLQAIGIEEIVISEDNVDGLVELAWYGLIDEARKNLPILLDDSGNAITDMMEIMNKIFERVNLFIAEKLNHKGERLKLIKANDCVEGTCVLH